MPAIEELVGGIRIFELRETEAGNVYGFLSSIREGLLQINPGLPSICVQSIPELLKTGDRPTTYRIEVRTPDALKPAVMSELCKVMNNGNKIHPRYFRNLPLSATESYSAIRPSVSLCLG